MVAMLSRQRTRAVTCWTSRSLDCRSAIVTGSAVTLAISGTAGGAN